MKWLAILFGIFVVAIIVLADLGTLPRYLGPIYDYPNGDKVGHFFLYGILTFLIDLTFFRSPAQGNSAAVKPGRRRVAVMIGLVLTFAITVEEFSQKLFSDHRTFDLVDLACSYLGIIFFSWLAVKVKK